MRQNPTRLPYSCQHQLGMSGIGEPPAGGVRTVRGIGCVASHSSTLTMVHTAMRAPSGSLSGARFVMGEYVSRSEGSIPVPCILAGCALTACAVRPGTDQSTLAPDSVTTLPHFSVSSATSFAPKETSAVFGRHLYE